MSMLFGPSSSDPALSGLPRGEVLGTYESSEKAREVVDRLAQAEFDVRTVSIVGTDLRTVERIRNRVTYASVALRAAVQGAFFGLLLGILMSLIDPSGAGVQILYTVALGVAIWVLFGVIGHAIRKGRGFTSVQQLVPTRFDVVCDFETAAQARQALAGTVPVPTPAGPAPGAGGGTPAASAPPAPTAATPPSASSAPPAGTPPVSSVPPPAGPAPGTPPEAATEPATPSGEGATQAPARTHHFPDLPDGRPQFGVRLPEAEAQALREQMLQDQTARAGGATGSFAAPDYGRGGTGRRSDPTRPVDDGPQAPAGTATGDDPGPASSGENDRYARPRYGRRAARRDPQSDQPPRPEQDSGKSGAASDDRPRKD